jgi:hypothetical protein
MKIYLAGPMTGLPELNYPAFFEAAKALEAKGYEVVNPAALFTIDDVGGPWEYYMRGALQGMLECDGIVLLKGSGRSKGATLELLIAKQLRFAVSHDLGETWERDDEQIIIHW